MMTETRQSSGLRQALEVWGRRRWLGILIFLGILVPALSFVLFLPDIYRASTTVLVERQQVPETLVRSAVTDELETRLHAISEEVLSRSKLTELVARFDLYPRLRAKVSPETVFETMRRDISLDLKGVERSWERGATVAFALGYRGRDPQKVAQVTNALAALFVEQNLKSREQQATRTADFLKSQLEEMKRKLEEQEARIGEYKRRHAGELPQQVEANIAVLERLNVQLQLNSEKQIRAMERRDRLAREASDAGAAGSEGDSEDTQARIGRLNRELAELRRQFNDNYPDVVRLKAEIASLVGPPAEARPEPLAKGAAAAPPGGTPAPSQRSVRTAEAEFAGLKQEEGRLRSRIADYERRIDSAPQRQQEFQELSRDYQTTKELYDSLLKRYEESLVSESMEHGQATEQFRILDPALPPRDPAAPNRFWLSLMALILSVGVAAGGMAVAEQLDTSFHDVESLSAFTSIPVLARIPRIATRGDLARKVVRVGAAAVLAAAGLLIAAGVSHFVAHDFEQMVLILSGGRL
jgi:succinoglycan biosynthesis transport protein ExoP